MEFIPSNRGGQQLLIDGHIYHKDYTRNNYTYWRCRDRQCRGRAKTIGQRYFLFQSHNHAADPLRIEECKTRTRMKGLVAANPTVPSSIMARFVLAEKSESVAALLPTPSTYSKMISRVKQRLEENVAKNEFPMQYVLAYFPCDGTFSIRSITVLRPDVDISKTWTTEELQAEGPFEIIKIYEGTKQLLKVDICAVSTDKAILRERMKQLSDDVAAITPIIDPLQQDVNHSVDNTLKPCKKVFFLSGNTARTVQAAAPGDASSDVRISLPSFNPTVNLTTLTATDRNYTDLLNKYNDLYQKHEALKKKHSACEDLAVVAKRLRLMLESQGEFMQDDTVES